MPFPLVEVGVKVPFDRVEVRDSLDTLDEVILETGLLDLVGSLMKQHLQRPFASGQSVTVGS